MSDYLNKLPPELTEQILDYVPTFDILSSVCFVSKRLRSISLGYPRFRLDFRYLVWTKKHQFDLICAQMRHLIPQIVSLTLFAKNNPMTPAKSALFFSRCNTIDGTFSNLRSLTLTHINYDKWCLFKTRLSSRITMLSIHLINVGESATSLLTSTVLSELLLFLPSLERLSLKMSNYSRDMVVIHQSNRSISSSVQSFLLESIRIDLPSLFAIAPMLRTFKIKYYSFMAFNNVYSRPLHLQRLSMNLDTITWKKIVSLLSSLSQLVHLTLITAEVKSDMADGVAWSRLLRNIKQFKFKFLFNRNAFRIQPINLNSFRTKFWLEEKKWFVSYDRSMSTGYSLLYSIPFCADEYSTFKMKSVIVSESTGSQSMSFPHTHRLLIDFDCPMSNALLTRHIRVNDLTLTSIGGALAIEFKDLATSLNTSGITVCQISLRWIMRPPDALIEFLHNLPCLCLLKVPVPVLQALFIHHWPHITGLKLITILNNAHQMLSPDGIDAFCRSFAHVEQIDIVSSWISDLPRLLNGMKTTLASVSIRQPQDVDNDQFITREWIEQKTELRNFHYACDAENCVSLWM